MMMDQVSNTNREALLKKEQAKAELWRRGFLRWKCHIVQQEMYDIFYGAPARSTLVWLVSRQLGKTWLLGILGLEQAIRKPNSIIKFVTDTKLHAETILLPKFEELLQDCPKDIKPEYKVKQYTFFFPNGSQIQLAGTDSKHYKRLRGQKSDLNLIDEGGFCNDLDEVVGGVLFPTTTHTKGKLVMASTMPEQQDHPFVTTYKPTAEFQGLLTEKTIDDNPLLTKEDIEQIAKAMGGRDSPRFRREYLNEIVKDPSISVIPEFNKELEKQIVKEWTKPPFYDSYVSMDLGGKDLTVVLYGYYDFVASKLVIEDEIKMDFSKPGNQLELLTKQMLLKESDLYYDSQINEQRKPYARVSDINPIVTQEITKYSYGKLYFTNAKKDDKDAALNDMRQRIGAGQIIINPKCKTLILHLNNVRWASSTNKDRFARSPDCGHYDAVDALKYMIRSVQFSKNPYPAHYHINKQDLFVPNMKKFEQETNPYEVYNQIFNSKKKIKRF